MEKPVLVVMAAGMGSRYGGLKQVDPVGSHGEAIMDFSLYDAYHAGFRDVVFVIKRAMEAGFREQVLRRISHRMRAECVFQELEDLPEGYQVPQGREKPWGTGHAVMACRHAVHAPFAVVNADDYYGREAFSQIYRFLADLNCEGKPRFAMVGYRLENALTENGHVARGVCTLSGDGMLQEIQERTYIEKVQGGARFTEDGGQSWHPLDGDCVVSMNLWGFPPSFLHELEKRFQPFLDRALAENPLKAEYFLPGVVDALIREGKAEAQVLHTPDKWYGVTYREDKPAVMEALAAMRAQGLYPEGPLWEMQA